MKLSDLTFTKRESDLLPLIAEGLPQKVFEFLTVANYQPVQRFKLSK